MVRVFFSHQCTHCIPHREDNRMRGQRGMFAALPCTLTGETLLHSKGQHCQASFLYHTTCVQALYPHRQLEGASAVIPGTPPTGRGTRGCVYTAVSAACLMMVEVVIHHQRPSYTSHMAFFSCMQGQLPTQCPQVLTDRCQVTKVYFDLLCERCSGPPHTM